MNSILQAGPLPRALRILSAAALAAPASALAGAGSMSTVVTPLTPAVTYSAAASGSVPALVTWVGYRVSISNVGGNTINAIRFTGTASATDAQEQVVFSSVEGASCSTTTTAKTAIECSSGTR